MHSIRNMKKNKRCGYMREDSSKPTIQLKLDSNDRRDIKIKFNQIRNVNNPKSIHGIYPYRGKISAIDSERVIHQLPSEGILLDPFCGSGTIIYEAQKWGLQSIGVDSNPLAVQISRGKVISFDKRETVETVKNMITEEAVSNSYIEMPEFAAKYFHPRTANQIMKIKNRYDELTPYLKAAFFGSIALSARACNHYKWSSNSIGKIIHPHKEVDFFRVFLKKTKKHMESIEHVSECDVFHHDSRCLLDIMPRKSVDYIFTSPPYFDALDYTSYYARIVYSIMNVDRAEIREGLIQKYSTYEDDMSIIMQQIEEVVKDDGIVIFVVGDKKTKDGIINGGEFFTNLTDWKPSYIVEREYSGSSSQIWDSINKTRRKEQIVVWDLQNS